MYKLFQKNRCKEIQTKPDKKETSLNIDEQHKLVQFKCRNKRQKLTTTNAYIVPVAR